MRKLFGVAPYLLVFICLACGNDLDGETLLGATCESSEDCDVADGICVRGGEGMCSRSCENPGAAQECPLGHYCDRGQVETTEDEVARDMTLCFPACKAQTDCRVGFKCKGVSSGAGKVCFPDES